MTEPDVAQLQAAVDHWGLTLAEPLAGGTSSTVYAARDRSGRALVLKLPHGRDDTTDVTAAETAALMVWAGSGVTPELLDRTERALLLTRVVPGTSIPWDGLPSIADLVALATGLLQRLWASPPVIFPFPDLARSFALSEATARADNTFERRSRSEPERGEVGVRSLEAARATAFRLLRDPPSRTLLHGDFITKNLIKAADSPFGYVAIDPLPMIGEPAAEIGIFAAYRPVPEILPTAELLARACGIPVARALTWAAVWSVHQSAQAWRDDQIRLDEWLSSDDVRALLN